MSWAVVPVLMWALAAAGASFARYPTTVLIVPGLAWAAVMAAREGWRGCGTGLAVAAVGVVGAFAGPAGSWAVAGVGLCAVLLGKAAAVAWRQRRDDGRAMTDDELDPLIHVPTRLKIVATLAALPDGDTLSFTRLQDMIGLTPGNLIIHLRKLEEADYISSEKTRNGTVSITTVALTGHGREALDAYTQALRDLLGGL